MMLFGFLIFLFPFYYMLLLGFIKVAPKLGLADIPNSRSSHDYPVVRGGGVVVGISWFIFMAFTDDFFSLENLGLLLIMIVGLYDDIKGLSAYIKLFFQFIAVFLLLYGLDIYALHGWFIFSILFILFTYLLNVFNFMDGINGILGLYSFIVLLFCLSYSGLFAYASGFSAVLFALLGFLVFNFRKRALMFAGDVGSLSLAYLICMALYSMDFQRVLVVDKASSVLFMFFPVSIFMADSFTTILHRIWLRENIFKSHRFHLYQLLTPHLINSQTRVSLIYAISQYLVLHIGMFIEKNVLNLLVYYIMLVVSFMILRLIITTKISTLQTSN